PRNGSGGGKLAHLGQASRFSAGAHQAACGHSARSLAVAASAPWPRGARAGSPRRSAHDSGVRFGSLVCSGDAGSTQDSQGGPVFRGQPSRGPGGPRASKAERPAEGTFGHGHCQQHPICAGAAGQGRGAPGGRRREAPGQRGGHRAGACGRRGERRGEPARGPDRGAPQEEDQAQARCGDPAAGRPRALMRAPRRRRKRSALGAAHVDEQAKRHTQQSRRIVVSLPPCFVLRLSLSPPSRAVERWFL
ncbi:unnamed protein product, partial [Prorocentrum cordatum]